MTIEARNLHLRNALGVPRTEMWDGREHLVVPCVALQEGVIHAINAETPELVRIEALTKAAHTWNGRPLVLGHPTKNGKQISANDPEVLAAHGFGFLRNSIVKGIRLGMEALVDPARLEALKQDRLLADIRAGKPVEVSVGAFVTTNRQSGSHNGKAYKAEWLEIVGDHLAWLPGGVGACSLEAGCGANRAAMHLVTAEGLELEEPKMTIRERITDLFRTAIGARNSATDKTTIQQVHDGAVTLGAECDKNWKFMEKHPKLEAKVLEYGLSLLAQYKDCSVCDGTGQVKKGDSQVDCEACEGEGRLKTAELKAACRCEEDTMSKETRVAALLKNEHNPLKDEKGLLAADEKALTTLEAHCENAATLKAAADKVEADRKTAELKTAEEKAAADLKAKSIEDRLVAAEASLKAAEANQVTDDIRALVVEKKAQDAAQKAQLVGQLKTAQSVYSEERLNAMPISQLQEIATLARVEAPDFSGRAMPRVPGGEKVDYTPPNPYEAGIKALQGKTVN